MIRTGNHRAITGRFDFALSDGPSLLATSGLPAEGRLACMLARNFLALSLAF